MVVCNCVIKYATTHFIWVTMKCECSNTNYICTFFLSNVQKLAPFPLLWHFFFLSKHQKPFKLDPWH